MKKNIIKLLFVLLFGVSIYVFFENNIYAKENSNDYDVNDYINNDYLLGDGTKTIKDYEKLHAQNGKIIISNYQSVTFDFENQGIDDEIIKIIPKKLFYTEGTTTEIGNEYGFFIKTTAINNFQYKSTVIVFDLSLDLNLEKNNDVGYECIKILYEYSYLCVKGNGIFKYEEYNLNIPYDVNDYWVVALPSSIGRELNNCYVAYDMINKYAIKDISFGATLMNEQNLNYGQEGYNAKYDNGSFFTNCDYSFSGYYYQRIPMSDDEILSAIMDDTMFVMGFVDTANILSTTYSSISLIDNNIKLAENIIYGGVEKIVFSENRFTAKNYYQNKEEQLNHYKDVNNNPYIVKSISCVINDDANCSINYSNNDYAIMSFNINQSALNSELIENTRITNTIALKVVDSSTNNIVSSACSSTSNVLREKVYKNININSDENLSFLRDGYNLFEFTPLYSGNYKLNIKHDNDITIYLNDKIYDGDKFYSNSGAKNRIEIKSNDYNSGTINIEISDSLDNINIRSNDYFILKINSQYYNNFVSISSNDCLFSKLFYTNLNTGLCEYTTYGRLYDDDSINYPMFNHDDYYILLYSTVAINNCNLNIEKIENQLNGEIHINKSVTYFLFDSNESGTYVINYKNYLGNNFQYLVIDYNGRIISTREYANGSITVNLNCGKYYIGFASGEKSNCIVNVNKLKDSYSWKISGGNLENDYYVNDSYVELLVGYTYMFNFYINGVDSKCTYIRNTAGTDLYGSYSYYFDVDGTLTLLSDSLVGGSGIEIKAVYELGVASYDQSLFVIPKFDISYVGIQSYSNDRVGFYVNLPKNILSFKYSVEKTGVRTISNTINNDNYMNKVSYNVDISSEYQLFNTQGNIKITLLGVYVKTILDTDLFINVNESTLVDSYFGGGSGTSSDPYIISTYRHFYNIRENENNGFISGYYKLTNSIIINSNDGTGTFENPLWTNIDKKFSGTLDGDGNSVYFAKVFVNSASDNFKGLFSVNYGTIKNINFVIGVISFNTTSNSNTNLHCGVISGENAGTITNCSFTSKNSDGNYAINGRYNNIYMGIYAGKNTGIIYDCYAYVNMLNYGNKGGIVGYNTDEGTIQNCTVDGKICIEYSADSSNQYSIGGICARNEGIIKNCTNYATLHYSGNLSDSRTLQPRIGQIVGTNSNSGKVVSCNCYGNASSENLKVVEWSTGWGPFKKNYSFDQTLYVNREIGYSE